MADFIQGELSAVSLDHKQLISFEELLLSQGVHQETLTRVPVEKGVSTKEEFLEMARVVNLEKGKLFLHSQSSAAYPSWFKGAQA
jgi:hypothetical protein